jgi:hypothetical protein
VTRLGLAVVCGAAGLLAACGSPIVGAECKPGFVICDGRCIDPKSNADHCGKCGHSCGGFECSAAMCTSTPLPEDAGLDGGPQSDAGRAKDAGPGRDGGDGGNAPPTTGRGGAGTPFRPDGGLSFPDPMVSTGCSVGETACGDVCSNTRSDPKHCGECGKGCMTGQFCAVGECVDVCDAPLSFCDGNCYDLQNDEDHCGSCGTACASGICTAGQCADVLPGSLVVVGHDYSTAASAAMKRIASNAVFLGGTPVKAVVYRGTAKQASADGIKAAIDSDGRSWDQVAADPEHVTDQLRGATAFVIEPQATSTNDELQALGQKWGLALSQFLLRGGAVVVFETNTTSNDGTYKILEPSGLFTASKREVISKQQLSVASLGDTVAGRVTPMYASATTTVHFLDVPAAGTVVVKDKDSKAVVYHLVAVAP